jgi:hypothetical protein
VAAGDWASAIHRARTPYATHERAREISEACEVSMQQLAVREEAGDLLGPAGKRADASAAFKRRAMDCWAIDHPRRLACCARSALHWDAGDRGEAVRCFQAGLL